MLRPVYFSLRPFAFVRVIEAPNPNVSSILDIIVLTQGSQGSKGLAFTCAPKEPIICLLLFVHQEDPLDRIRGMVTRYLLPLVTRSS